MVKGPRHVAQSHARALDTHTHTMPTAPAPPPGGHLRADKLSPLITLMLCTVETVWPSRRYTVHNSLRAFAAKVNGLASLCGLHLASMISMAPKSVHTPRLEELHTP